MSTMTVTVYATQPLDPSDSILLWPSHMHDRTQPNPTSILKCVYQLRIFQIIITMLLWKITAVHLRRFVAFTFTGRTHTCCSLVLTHTRRRRLFACKSSHVLMPGQVKLKLPRARAERNTFHVNEQHRCSSLATATMGAVMREQHRIYIYGLDRIVRS